jgi:hypothetical protein
MMQGTMRKFLEAPLRYLVKLGMTTLLLEAPLRCQIMPETTRKFQEAPEDLQRINKNGIVDVSIGSQRVKFHGFPEK